MSYYFKGDLLQMSAQRQLLNNYGYKIIMNNVYPTVETKQEFEKAVKLIFTMKCEGWWHYKDTLIEMGICTPYEYWKSLSDLEMYHRALEVARIAGQENMELLGQLLNEKIDEPNE